MTSRLRLLGSPRLETASAAVDETGHETGVPTGSGLASVRDLPIDKPAALLYYLAVRGDWVRRAELAYLIRPDAPESVAQANVRVLLHRAKGVAPSELEVERGRVRWRVDTDVADFRRAIGRRDDVGALQLYSGPFLDGVNVPDSPGLDTWLELERAELQNARRAAALRVSARLRPGGELVTAVEQLEAVLADDPFDEEVVQAYLRVLFAAGRTEEAKAAYERLTQALAEELEAEPLPSTVELYKALGTGAPSADSRERGLPSRTTRFHGRRQELSALAELLARADTRLVTITGLGGVGKSRLALESASRQLPNYPDGVWFVELAGVATPDLLPQTIGAALQVDLSNAKDPRTALFDRLRANSTLLILDNFEHLIGGESLLTELLAEAPELELLVTSRTSLGLGAETIFELGGLGVPPRGATTNLDQYDAVALFIDRAERHAPGFVAAGRTLEAVAELTRRVEGLPLALELAATWTRSLTMPELLDALERNLDLLSGTLHELPARQRSLRAVIDHSFALLTQAERTALARLSVYHGGFDSGAAERVAGVHHGLLFGLVAHSLVGRSATGRFHVHELVRQYAAERLARDSGEGSEVAELQAAHARHYLELPAAHAEVLRTSSRAAALDELSQDLDNIRAALAHASRNTNT